MAGLDGLPAQVPGREVELLVVERVVGDVHLPVDAGETAVDVVHGRGVVVEPGRAALEDRADDHDLQLLGQEAEGVGGRSRHRLGQREVRVVLGLAEVLAAEELGERDDLGSGLRGLANGLEGGVEIAGGVAPAAHLDERDGELFRGHRRG